MIGVRPLATHSYEKKQLQLRKIKAVAIPSFVFLAMGHIPTMPSVTSADVLRIFYIRVKAKKIWFKDLAVSQKKRV